MRAFEFRARERDDTLSVEEATPHRDRNGMSPVVRGELGENATHVILDRVFRNREARCGELIRVTTRNESQDLDLSRRQNGIANMLRDEQRDFRRNAALSIVYCADRC